MVDFARCAVGALHRDARLRKLRIACLEVDIYTRERRGGEEEVDGEEGRKREREGESSRWG